MDSRQCLEAFWDGQRPDRIPYTIYDNEFKAVADDPAWLPMFEAGLLVTWGRNAYRLVEHGTERSVVQLAGEGARRISRQIARTPVGEICLDLEDGWVQSYWLRGPEDYRVMRWIVEHTEILPNHEALAELERRVGRYGVVHPCIGRTPMQSILVDFAGLENFAFHLLDYEEEVLALYAALLKSFRRQVEIAAETKGRYVAALENFTAETMGPERFERFHLPVYQELFPLLQQAGKVVGTHYDGKLASCKDAIAKAPTNIIESLTPPPEGDLTLAEARAAWPEKLFWSNINVMSYQLPPQQLKRLVQDAVMAAAPDGRRLAFEVSEHLPANWKQSMPVVLEALREI